MTLLGHYIQSVGMFLPKGVPRDDVLAEIAEHLRSTIEEQGVRAFVRNRTTRVIVPLVVGWMVFFPMIATALVLAAGNATPPAPSAGAMQRSASREAESLAHRVAVLAKGRLVATGSVDEMRGLVARRRIRCRTRLMPDEVRAWPGVVTASLTDGYLQVVSVDADAVVRRLLRADEEARDLEVQRAGLAEAFTELTQEAA